MGLINDAVSAQAMAEPSTVKPKEKKTERKTGKEKIQKEEQQGKEGVQKNEKKVEKRSTPSIEIPSMNNLYLSREKEKQKNDQWKVKKSIKISAVSYMMRLANASTPTAVAGVLRSARADQSFVKRSGASKQEIAKALAIIKKVIASGNKKIAELKKEERMENLKRSMRSSHNYNEEERLRKELRKQRKARRARELAGLADMEQVTIHDHNQNMLCPNELCMAGLFRDLSREIRGDELNLEVGADASLCCADVGEPAALDLTI